MSNLIFSQGSNTNPTKCFDQAQVNEIFKGLKQNGYLKERLSKTEDALKNADDVIESQQIVIHKNTQVISLKDEIIKTNEVQYVKDKEILEIEIQRVNELSKVQIDLAKKEARKSYWKGIKTGGVIGIAATAVAVFLIIR